MDKLRKIRNVIDTVNDWVGKIVRWLLVAICFILSFEVISRYFFDSPTIWAQDVSKQLLAVVGCMGGGYALLYNSHVKVDVFWERWSVRTRAIVDIFTSILFFVYLGLMLYNCFDMAAISWSFHERTTSVFAPVLYPLKTIIVIGVFFCFIQGISKLIHDILVILTGESENLRNMGY
ncbi:MAG: TRAP transporter small permease subunit [Anaerovoracaceae bacterium]